MNTLFQVLIPTTMLLTLAALGFGMYTLFRGGDFGRSWSNRMMRVRVLAQFVAVLVLMAALWWSQSMRGG